MRVFSVVDGGILPFAEYVDHGIQNAYFEVYTKSVQVTNLLFINFKGQIIHAVINYPGFFHYSNVLYLSGIIFPKTGEEITPPYVRSLAIAPLLQEISAVR